MANNNPTGKGGFQTRKHQINRKGRPRSFDKLRELAQQIGHEPARGQDGVIIANGKKVTVTEAILRQWSTSKSPRLQQQYMEIAYGKVPKKHEVKHEVTWKDEVVEALVSGKLEREDVVKTWPKLANEFFKMAGFDIDAE